MQEYNNIFDQIDNPPQALPVASHSPGVKKIWRKYSDQYQCAVTGRKLSKIAFRAYREKSRYGGAEFIIQIF